MPKPARFVAGFTKVQKRKFFPHYVRAKSYYVSGTAVAIETRNNVLRNRKLDFTQYLLCTVYHSTSSQVFVHQLLPASVKMPAKCGHEFRK